MTKKMLHTYSHVLESYNCSLWAQREFLQLVARPISVSLGMAGIDLMYEYDERSGRIKENDWD